MSPSATRVVGYHFDDVQTARALDNADIHTAIDRYLTKAAKLGVVTQYDVGRQVVWFNGRPGRALRVTKAEVERLLSGSKT